MSQRRAVVGIALAASTLMLASCGFQAPPVTEHEHSSIQGRNFSVGSILVRNAHITGQLTSSGEKSYLVVTFVNTSQAPETLNAITSTTGSVKLTGAGVSGGSLVVPPKGVPLIIEQPLANPLGPSAQFVAATTPGAGTFVPMSFDFGTAGTSPIEQIPVIPGTETTAATTTLPTEQATPPPVEGEPASD